MKTDILDIVKEKNFVELTAEELNGLANYCSTEEEYNQLKQVLVGVNAMDWTNPVPKAETKERLDVLFAQSYPKVAPVWYSGALALVVPKHKPFQRQPLVQIAAVGLLVFLTVPFFNSNEVKDTQVVLAENRSEEGTNTANEDAAPLKDESLVETVSADNEARTSASDADREKTPSPGTSAPVVTLANNGLATALPFDHPDGIHTGEKTISYSLPASEQPEDLMDLLTSTF